MAKDLEAIAKKQGIKYFLISFVDLFGVLRSKLVPARAIKGMQKEGAGFAGFAAWLDMTPAHPDLFAIPDPDSLIQLPWKPEVAWLASDLWMDGKEVEASPRVALKRQLAKAQKKGYRVKTGVECEFFLTTPDGKELSDPYDTQEKPCYDQSALMRRYEVISEICDHMIDLGWGPYQNDHEDANGQWEMNWDFDDALKTADKHTFFKFMAKAIAEEYGYRATFMPKPFIDRTGNGCHAHVSVWDKAGKKNLFLDSKDEMGMSKMSYQFLGGMLHHAQALCSIFNPTVNSYKRINAPVTSSGATWAPNTVTYGGNNRTHMVRIPGAGRYELRLMDGAANPYLMQAGMIAAGLDGVANKRDPGERLDIDMYADGHKIKGAKKLPLNMLDALRLTDASKDLRAAMGDDLIDSYIKLKNHEWDRYCHHLSGWERENTLDC
ncbi:MAG: type III glutamate--ammonia ligase [Rhodospirillaceae bacterium]|nr:type III glutamate--ammonia ligase [Rhodospirillaceae bacterium]MBL6930560.1 type III glutamate--ammonia ligase [Rhodospirillales bacterium]